MSRRNSAGGALDRARAVLSETQAKLAALATERNTALLRGTDADVAKVDAEVEATEKLLRTHGDRVKLLEVEAEKEEAARRAKEHAAPIGRVEAKLAERDAIVAELAAHVAAADSALVKLFAANKAVLAGWPWENGHVGAALLGAGDTVRVLSNEIYRIGGRAPSTGGMPGDVRGPSFPGGKCANLLWVMMPERSSPPMIARFAEASAAASVIMKTGRNSPAPAMNGAAQPPADASPTNGAAHPPVAPGSNDAPVTPASGLVAGQINAPIPETDEARAVLRRLLQRQAELSEQDGEEAEAAYRAVGERIAALS